MCRKRGFLHWSIEVWLTTPCFSFYERVWKCIFCSQLTGLQLSEYNGLEFSLDALILQCALYWMCLVDPKPYERERESVIYVIMAYWWSTTRARETGHPRTPKSGNHGRDFSPSETGVSTAHSLPVGQTRSAECSLRHWMEGWKWSQAQGQWGCLSNQINMATSKAKVTSHAMPNSDKI